MLLTDLRHTEDALYHGHALGATEMERHKLSQLASSHEALAVSAAWDDPDHPCQVVHPCLPRSAGLRLMRCCGKPGSAGWSVAEVVHR